MKINRLKNLTLMIGAIAFIGSCITPKLIDPNNRKTKNCTSEQQEMVAFLEERNIDLSILQSTFQNTNTSSNYCINSCCDTLLFCPVSGPDIMDYIERYRNEDWKYTSNLFRNDGSLDVDQTMKDLAKGTCAILPNPYLDAKSFDARFMDIPINELENYLCYIKTDPVLSDANICRFYYMKYDDSSRIFMPEYRNKHTLAIVPVEGKYVSGGVSTVQEFTENSIFTIGLEDCPNSPMANHNHLCPPFDNCTKNTLLIKVDEQ